MIIGEEIANCIKKNEQKIRTNLRISDGQWFDGETSMIKSIMNIAKLEKINENYLTFIMSCAYAMESQEIIRSLQQILCTRKITTLENNVNPIWFQYSPYAVNKEHGRGRPSYSKFDLAFGDIEPCTGESYIAYGKKDTNDTNNGWICCVEMKILTDISVNSTDNPNYNQLAKYIKVALTLQKFGRIIEGRFPSEVYLSLVTPRRFIDNRYSRLYGYKFDEYTSKDKIDFIKKDIPQKINHEYFNEDWLDPMQQPDIDNRLKSLKLIWIPYENLLDNIPDTNPLKNYIDRIREANPIFDKSSESK